MFRRALLSLLPTLIALSAAMHGQTFRGGLTGVVVDTQGAVVANAAVQLRNPDTDTVQNGKSNGAGEFNFPELPPGTYQLTVTLAGFKTQKIDDIDVAVSKTVNVKVELAIGSESTVVDVVANGVQIDTTSSALVSVVDSKSVQDMPMNGRDFTKMVRFNAGVVGSGYSNGNSHINYQVDGTDNVDSWLGIVASNQGGIASVPGGLIPIEAIDQFSIQSQGEADMGRNAGSNQNMVLKSGTNQIHGDVFYYNRNEFFAAITPVSPVNSRKAPIRNNQFGFTLGGPLWKDHTFLFLAGEIQLQSAGNSLVDTALNDAWIAAGKQMLGFYGLAATQNAVTASIYKNIFPAVANNAGAATSNFFASAPNEYNSYNGVIKLDHHFSEKQTLSIRYLGTTGRQTAYRGTGYAQFFQTAPMHIHNFSVIETTIFNPHLLNQVTLGTNYFLQTFNDADQNYNPGANDGLNLGLTGIIAAGSPTVTVSGFDIIGQTQPSGRTDVTGQVTDSLRWTVGRHSLKFGGEYRHTNVYSISLGSSRGTFTYDGTAGPWSSTSSLGLVTATCKAQSPSITTVTACANYYCKQIAQASSSGVCNTNILGVADFVYGQSSVTPANLAKFRIGNATRTYLLNQLDFWASDSFQATQKLSLNYGIRWSIPGVVTDQTNDLFGWSPQGFTKPLYNQYYGAWAPRLGFAYSPFDNSRTVLRGAWGIIYDVPAMSSLGVGASNPAGPNPSYVASTPSFSFVYGVNPFTTAAIPPQFTGVGVQKNFRIAYGMNFSLGIEQQLSKSTLLSIGYIGSEGRRIPVTYDLNQATGYTTSTNTYHRPFDLPSAGGAAVLQFPGQTVASNQNFTSLTQLVSGGTSNFNSFNVTVKQTAWKGVTVNANYIWGHSLDDGTAPINNHNIKFDYGNGTGDTRHTFDGFVTWDLPKFTSYIPRLTQGWQLNGLFSFYTGGVISPAIGKDYSFTGQSTSQRPNLIPGVPVYIPKTTTVSGSGARVYTTINRAAFDYPIAGNSTGSFGVYGNLRRDQFYGPGFGDFDFSLFKYTPINERFKTEFRAEVFNLFNQSNLANPSVTSLSSTTFGQISQTKNGSGAPGTGYGEPFNVQFALKILF